MRTLGGNELIFANLISTIKMIKEPQKQKNTEILETYAQAPIL